MNLKHFWNTLFHREPLTEELLLEVINYLQPNAYADHIRQEVSRRLCRFVSSNLLYVALGRLEKKVLVFTHFDEPIAERGNRQRLYY